MVIEGEYRVGHQEQLYIENQAMIAVPRPDGGITVHGSLQCPYYIHKAHEARVATVGCSRPSSSRLRPVAASVAKRNTRR